MTKQYEFDKGSSSVYTLNYHLIICIKYRRKVFTTLEIINELKSRTRKISNNFDIIILNQECDKDHTHILFKATPGTNLRKFINALKGATSNAIRHRFPEVRKKRWDDIFWSKSYCLITTGQTTLDQLKKYVDNQGKPKKCN